MENMKKNTIILLILVLVLSGCTKKEGLNNGNQNQGRAEKVESGNEKESGALASLKDLLSQNKSQKCTWNYEDGGQLSRGTMNISGNKFKQEVETTIENKKTSVVTVSDGEWLYIWNSGMAGKGIKTKVEDSEKTDKTAPEAASFGWGKQYKFKCEPTLVSDAELEPPRDVEFTDMNELLKGLEEMQKKFGGQ